MQSPWNKTKYSPVIFSWKSERLNKKSAQIMSVDEVGPKKLFLIFPPRK